MTLALLHTSPVHVPVFDALRDADHPGLALRHLVHEELLLRAGDRGPGAVSGAVRERLVDAVGAGASAVLCTCSTIGGVAESLAAEVGVPVLRVDRPMAAAAVRVGRVVVLAALAATLAPTLGLLAEEAGERSVDVRSVLVEGAWERFVAGDRDGFLDLVAAAADAVRDADVIVLAQASMAAAADRASTPVPVLSSPRSGLAAAAAVARRFVGVRAAADPRPSIDPDGSFGTRTHGLTGRGRPVRGTVEGDPPRSARRSAMTNPYPDPVPPAPTPGPMPEPPPMPQPPPVPPGPVPPGPAPDPIPQPPAPNPEPVPEPEPSPRPPG